MDDKVDSSSSAKQQSDSHDDQLSCDSSVSSASRQSTDSPNRSSKHKTNLNASKKDSSAKKAELNGKEVKFDLSDPADILKKLESTDLTEEETEELLKQAYELNKKLKRHMHLQEMSTHNSPLAKPIPGPGGLGGRSRTMYPALPPISSYGRKASPDGGKLKSKPAASKSVPEFTRQHTQQKMKTMEVKPGDNKRPSSKPKPEWNDRFSYT